MTQKHTTQKFVAIFFSNDLVGHSVRNDLIPYMMDIGLIPILYETTSRPLDGRKGELVQEIGFYETDILENTVFPYLEQNPLVDEDVLTTRQVAEKYGLIHRVIDDVNDPAFIAELSEMEGLIGGISIRNRAIFRDDMIALFKGKGFFWNLHGGLLPGYRGAYVAFRALINGEKNYGWTLHEIDRGIDTGDVITMRYLPLKSNQPVLQTYLDMAPFGASMIMESLQCFLRYGFVQAKPQDKFEWLYGKAHYYTFPTQDELEQWGARGFRYADMVDVPSIYADVFSQVDTTHGQGLRNEVIQAIAEYHRDDDRRGDQRDDQDTGQQNARNMGW